MDMIIDANIFIGESLHRNSLSIDQLNALINTHHLDKVIVRPLKPMDYNFDKANCFIHQIQAQHSNVIGFGRVNPWEKDAPSQVQKAIQVYGLKGIHLHPWEENFSIADPVVYDVMDMIEALDIPVYISTGYPMVSEPLQLLELAQKYSHVTILATHGGQLDISGMSFDDALILAKEAKNVLFDISGVYRRDFIELLINSAGEEHVIFGSCAPYMDIGLEIERIKAAQIPESYKEKIFSGNISKLFL
jgi:predicted TIM-barrel fold metal-dependent hydrolase